MFFELQHTTFGCFGVAADSRAVKTILFEPDPESRPDIRPNAVTAETFRQLKEYFQGKRTVFDLPVAPEGTSFRLSVWDALRRVPFGCTVSYGELARLSGHPGAARAVGSAMHANPIPLVIPCHRVLASDGSIGGFSLGLPLKRRLLSLERSFACPPR